MNIFTRILFGSGKGRKPMGRSPADRLYVVDATGLVNTRQRSGNGQGSPRDHALVLRNLVQFASRESIRMTAVFVGRQLTEASEGSTSRGVTVHYVDSPDGRKQKILTLVRKNRRKKDIVVLTSDTQIEREVLASGVACMRLSTLKKALEGREERERYSSARRPAPRRPHADRAGPENKTNPPAPESRDAAVFSLIDPV